ncbi:MAG: hypothetical protein SGBAC_012866 [Bacillariaceae sp.]
MTSEPREVEEAEAPTDDAEVEENSNGNDVLTLNISGTIMQVLRRTLCSHGHSLLASQFSGKYDDRLIKDADGNFFVNQSFALFSIVLDQLRSRDTWTPHSPPLESPMEEDFSNHRQYLQFLSLVEYYGITPVIYPTRIKIHKGNKVDSKIEQYPYNFVAAMKLSTFVIQTEGHSRSITSFEIKVGKIEDFRVGWAGDEFVILDCLNAKLHMKGGAIVKAKTPFKMESGGVMRCVRSASVFTWEFNGKVVFQHALETSSTSLIPAFKGKGAWQRWWLGYQ